MDQRIHARYRGNVQGVGFRYTVERTARELGIRGWVRNLRDGSVEVEAEAPKEALSRFLDRIQESFAGYIRSSDIDWTQANGEFGDFTITF